MAKNNRDSLVSLLVLGDTTVGKTCLILRFCENSFQDSHLITMGIDFKMKDEMIDDKKITVKIFDTAGQERFRSMSKSHYKSSDGIILMYDVTNRKSFECLKEWIESIKEKASETIQIIIVGNKIDEIDKRDVTTEEGSELAKEFNVDFFEMSAKENVNVRESVIELVKKVVKVKKETYGMALERKNAKKKKCC